MIYRFKFGALPDSSYRFILIPEYKRLNDFYFGIKIKNDSGGKYINHLPNGTLVLWNKVKQEWFEFK